MTPENWLVLAILFASITLFVSDKFRVDFVALLVLLALILTGLLEPAEAFAGFASPAVITVWAVFIISGGIFQSGIADKIAEKLLKSAGADPLRLLVIIMLMAGVMSAFMNNIGAVAILLPAVITVCRQLRISPSKMLIPLSFAALLGGNMTLIGTPPNILATDILRDYGQVEPFEFFDFLPMGIIILITGIIYMLLIGRHLLPERDGDLPLSDKYHIREYVTEMQVTSNSPLLNKQVTETDLAHVHDVNVLSVRHKNELIGPQTEHRLEVGDVLLIAGSPDNILQVSKMAGLNLSSDWQHSGLVEKTAVAPADLHLSEVVLSPRTRVEHQTLKELGFRARHGVSVLAIQHSNKSITNQLGDVPIQSGDALLVQGTTERLTLLQEDPNYLVLNSVPQALRRTEKAPLTIIIAIAVLVAITLGWLDTSTAMLLGAVSMIGFGVLTMDEAYESIDWKSVFLIAGMLPLGLAMEQTGTAKIIADQIVSLFGTWGALGILAGIFVLTALLTEVISNAAATVLMVPIAIDAAFQVGAAPQPFVMAMVIAASTSFLMPIGHQVNVIIYGPGGYKFSDYTKVGVGLNLLLLIVVLVFLPLFWPLFP